MSETVSKKQSELEIATEKIKEVFEPAGYKVLSVIESEASGRPIFTAELGSVVLKIGSVQLTRLMRKGLILFSFCVVYRGNKQVLSLEFMENCDYIEESHSIAKACGDI